ncbi:MAG TPA: bifunctional methylenetetrahydrofolate dehydrogenase/methenyltetrahydrofolate cyclohydrolase FolD [Sphaerochaeta sp.]|nr:bifunctional methylenetetrahydrofolate dehydrogenase/methenyltetrahydrofolate cyclohydrolase FolD [Sphaerochaeta sp.]
MQVLKGKAVADQIYTTLEVESATVHDLLRRPPCLAVLLVGDDPASASYVASKQRACERLGIDHRDYHLPADTTEAALLARIEALNTDDQVDGILVQLPLPEQINEETIIGAIKAAKDVDGFHPYNVGSLLIGMPTFVSCTPLGILAMLDYYEIATSGKHVVIIGRSNIVGKPLAALLMQKGRDATVTVAHSRTNDLASLTRSADILIVAIGRAGFVTADMVGEGAIVIDVGINRVADASTKRGYRIVGDVAYEEVAPKCKAITPVPGGVGVMTIAMLMHNTIASAKRTDN